MQRSGGELLVDCLLALGATDGFGVPGESYLAVLDAFHDRTKDFRFTICRNEGGASFMAAAQGKLSGRPGLCFVTRGPGATNASIGVHTAFQDSAPMLLFVGQVGTEMRGREAFQEIDYRRFYGDLTKWVVEIDDCERIPELISRAWATAVSGRPGPVVVALPENMLRATTSVEPCRPVRIAEASPPPDAITSTIEILSKAERPLVIVGGGGWSAEGRKALDNFCLTTGLPLVAAFRYQELCNHDNPSYIGDAGVAMPAYMRDAIRQSDVILAIGIRFGEMVTGGYELFDCPHPAQTLIHSHASDHELNKIYQADVPVHSSSNQMCKALLQSVTDGVGDRLKSQCMTWLEACREGYLALPTTARPTGKVDMLTVTRYVQDHIPDDAIITNGAGNFAVWPNRFMRFTKEMRLLAPQSGAMGFGVPAAIAAKRLHPERSVICFAGDGDFQMNGQEIGTAAQYNCVPIILILNNGTYGTIRTHQEREYPGRPSGTEIVNPDYATLAKAYGIPGFTVTTTDEFSTAFDAAISGKKGALIELVVD